MNPKNPVDPEDDDLGVLDETPSSDTTGIGLIGGTAHVDVVLPTGGQDDESDDEVVDDELVDDAVAAEVVSDLVIDTSSVADAEVIARMQQDAPDVIIELPAEDLPAASASESEDAATGAELVVEVVEDEAHEDTADEDVAEDEDEYVAYADEYEDDDVADEYEDDEDEDVDPADAVFNGEDESADSMTEEVVAEEDPLVEVLADEDTGDEDPTDEDPTDADRTGTAAAPLVDAGGPASPATAPRSTEPAPAEVELSAKRFDDLDVVAGSESADLLTPDRLLDPARIGRPEPEGTWSHLLYSLTGGRINVGDSRHARERKQLTARIAAPLAGSARFVPVLSRKGGVGKTTVTALLGMALADAREDRVIAVDANPDRGTLAERVVGGHSRSVRDLVRAQHDIRGFHDLSALVGRDETRLDVLASDADPRVSEAFGDGDYRDVATVAAQYYSLVLTDSGTGIVHSVMGATLDLADQIIIVSGLSVDEARLASETLTWLESNGYAALAREAIVVLDQAAPGAPLVRLSELEAHFSTRARHVLRIPYDPQIAGGGPIDFARLQPATRRAAREIAATLIEGLRAGAAS
ncbi:MinD/ParA family ATP-binding protein [Microbacterium sp. USHLN186]|uniref:MinD/ParA family ATP-binding protein n=1 Tax=Microbacterium sp. USHLN186 TaxID=3081286 RepID=UPI003018493D